MYASQERLATCDNGFVAQSWTLMNYATTRFDRRCISPKWGIFEGCRLGHVLTPSSERLRMEKDQVEQAAFAAMDCLPVGAVVIDRRRTIVLANHAARRTFAAAEHIRAASDHLELCPATLDRR